jgi:phosphate transport system substrate-binding protein
VNQTGGQAWPITGATFILVYKSPDKPEQVTEVLKFFDWAYKNGDKLAAELDYVPLPDKVADQVRDVGRRRSRTSPARRSTRQGELSGPEE